MHEVEGLIAPKRLNDRVCAVDPSFKAIPLPQELFLVPLQYEYFDRLGAFDSEPVDGEFKYLNEKLLSILLSLSESGPILYFETNYFGGSGQQGALICDKGQVVFGPEISEQIGPINRALKILGVTASPSLDEFDTIGLGDYRTSEDWIEQPKFEKSRLQDFKQYSLTRYGWSFLILAIAVSCLALYWGKWWLFLNWLSLDFLIIALGYAVLGSDVFGKHDGRLPIGKKLLFLPYLLYSGIVWHLYLMFNREHPYDHLSDDLIIGRRVRAHELPQGVVNVVDLTAEQEDPFEIRKRTNYINLPILDAGVPDPIALQSAISRIAPGLTYIHCAQGHGRTALFALALLAERDRIRSFEEGMELIKNCRPGIGLNRTQQKFIKDYIAVVYATKA